MNFEEHLLALRVVGSVQPGYRLAHANGSALLVSRPGVVDSLMRFARGEGRARTCSTIASMLSASAERLQDMEHSRVVDDQEESMDRQALRQRAEQLRDALGTCITGIQNLQTSYAADTAAVAHLGVLGSKCRHLQGRGEELCRLLGRGRGRQDRFL